MTRRPVRALATLLCTASAALLVACGDPTAPAGRDSMDPREILQFPTFRADVLDIFRRNGCSTGCHDLGQGGLTLLPSVPATTYAQLVNQPAHLEDFLRVEPSDPDNSYLVIKLEGRNASGSRMPPGGELDLIDLTNLRRWIENGAPND